MKRKDNKTIKALRKKAFIVTSLLFRISDQFIWTLKTGKIQTASSKKNALSGHTLTF